MHCAKGASGHPNDRYIWQYVEPNAEAFKT
jgi:hypothetical protein